MEMEKLSTPTADATPPKMVDRSCFLSGRRAERGA